MRWARPSGVQTFAKPTQLRSLSAIIIVIALIGASSAIIVIIRHLGADDRRVRNAAASASGSLPIRAASDADTLPLPRTGPAIRNPLDGLSGFVHPGVLVTAQQLEFVRERINAGVQPWTSAFSSIVGSDYASLSWKPKPRPVVDCGPYSEPNHGCREEEADGVAAYTHALLWYFTQESAHAKKAIEIIDAWSGKLREHTNRNAPLQAGWSAATFVRAAELMRHTYHSWPKSHSDRAASMFRNAYLPLLMDGAGTAGGNWELIMLDAAVGIAVFLDDRALFDRVVAKWRLRVKAYIYITEDGPYPNGPPGGPSAPEGIVSFWFGQNKFVNGLSQETCRDLGHTAWGLSALAHVAETAWIQGVDLYSEVRKRMTNALELHASYELGKTVPYWLCGGTLQKGFRPSPEVAYNHYAGRLVLSLPNTKRLVESLRPAPAGFFYGWETLTHAGIAP